MERDPRRLFIVALLLGLLTALFIYLQLERIEKENRSAAVLVPVVVAARDISAPVRLTADMIAVREASPEWRHPEAAQAPEEVVGLWATRDFKEGEQILKPLLAAGEGRDALAYRIPAGMRAVTIAINAVTGVAGQLRQGDRVDVLATLEKQLIGVDLTVTLLQDIEVLAVGTEGEQVQGSTVTLAVTPKQAEELTLADEKGRLRLVLRPAAETGRIQSQGVTPEMLVQERR